MSAHRDFLLSVDTGRGVLKCVLVSAAAPPCRHGGPAGRGLARDGTERVALDVSLAVLSRVQTDLAFRGTGLGRLLLSEAARRAHELGLQQLHIAVRGGQDIERFYARLGWQEIGRWPAALRLGPGDDRDEGLMTVDRRPSTVDRRAP
jgi:GNAT superfamily N-acetyltransferase